MKEYKVITALFLSAVMLGTAPLTVWGAESFSTGESFSDGTENIPDIVTDSALSGESSERDYELSIETGTDVELTESDFYDPEFRVEKYVKVRNSGKKETRVRVDASGLKNFEVDDQMAKCRSACSVTHLPTYFCEFHISSIAVQPCNRKPFFL